MSLGNILVTGGCGFLGFHIVQELLKDPQWASIHVMSRNPTRNRLPGVQYHAGSVSSQQDVRQIIDEAQPTVIVHTASPQGTSQNVGDRRFFEANVQGTQKLLDYAVATQHVRAFVYTSSMSVVQNYNASFADESVPLKTNASSADEYGVSKAMADELVREYNGRGGMKTVCLRVTSVYGERDNQFIPPLLDAMRSGRQNVQIGDNKNLYDNVSVENAVKAHMLAIKALLSKTPPSKSKKVDGEAFFITDGRPLPFWTFVRKIWAAAGDSTPPEQIKVVPAWLMLNVASIIEWFYWVFTLGQLKPRNFSRHMLEHVCKERTFAIQKAKDRLGYEPDDNREENIRKGVQWELQKGNQTT